MGFEIIKDFDVYEQFEQPLVKAGWDVIVFVPSKEEDADRITCGKGLVTKQSRRNAGANAIRHLFNAVGIIPALAIAKPASGIRNILGGLIGLYMTDYNGINLHEAMKQYRDGTASGESTIEGKTAMLVDNAFKKYFQSPKITGQYESTAEAVKDDTWYESVARSMNDNAMKIADVFSEGLFLKNVEAFKNFFTVKGSEKNILRVHMKGLLYAKSIGDLKLWASGEGQKADQETVIKKVEEIVGRNMDDAWYMLSDGLGLFSKDNKPFHEAMMLESADTASKVILGGLGKALSFFKTVTRTNEAAIAKALVSTSYKLTNQSGMMTGQKNSLAPTLILF